MPSVELRTHHCWKLKKKKKHHHHTTWISLLADHLLEKNIDALELRSFFLPLHSIYSFIYLGCLSWEESSEIDHVSVS